MLKKAFFKQYDGIIWKINPDQTGTCLVLEIRNGDKKKAFFSGISLPAGTTSFDNLQLQEPWFCGLEGVAHGRAYLHGYLSETLPGHRGIFAVDLKNGDIIWENYNLVYGYATKEGLIAWNYKSEPRRYQLIAPGDGSTIRMFNSPAEPEVENAPLPAPPVHFPARVTIDKDWLAHLPARALAEADLLEWKGRWILAFYTKKESVPGQQKMDHHLYVIDRNRRLIHQDLLAGDIRQAAMDTFFLMNDQLFYIRSKSEILAYFL